MREKFLMGKEEFSLEYISLFGLSVDSPANSESMENFEIVVWVIGTRVDTGATVQFR